jgi:hypothetical protein
LEIKEADYIIKGKIKWVWKMHIFNNIGINDGSNCSPQYHVTSESKPLVDASATSKP